MYPRFHAEPRSHAILSRMLEWSANEKQALLEHLTRTYTTVMDSKCRFSELDRLTRPLDRHVMLLPQRCVTIQGDFFSPLQGKGTASNSVRNNSIPADQPFVKRACTQLSLGQSLLVYAQDQQIGCTSL